MSDLERGLTIANENMGREIASLHERVRKAEATADYWREAWEKIIYDIGDLMREVKGNATRGKLAAMLTRQGDEPK